jgi:hypothetical protein
MAKWDRAWDDEEKKWIPVDNAEMGSHYYCCRNKCQKLFLRSSTANRKAHFWKAGWAGNNSCEAS